ncbi:hemerythrin domain-containing protein [Romboutsia sp. CE17]|uniref:hemerythrin domain-containing protein n=1 Tax=Romboutsia sp. CE17 TaxID=2724150 RepID=UPI001442AC92|nr:hemerythrin domain-containing protein [Romboutsia sp. CE17]QJA08117.1 hemerythrin domain-containing protein [Romboutsia sp. CE17]
MNAIDIMNEEHKYITRMLKVIRKVCFKLMEGENINYDDFYLIIDFVKNYADSHHHKKEEKILFNRMVDNLGDLANKVINHGMLVEHDYGRLYMRNLGIALEKLKNGDKEAKLDVIANAISYTNLLERHIDKEDRVIYKFAERELSKEILEIVDIECNNYEDNNIEVKEKNIAILESLERKYIKEIL